ncbi:SigB/SigF/SigG family RNA polymerase sigma factor [Patulibacter minatonensis]|uniref:SigB/SigF/SigG family RNA polymerase sigma factor n=1 Tax=Patulibacter minatonensis TaxID=298163 RepID=UPI0004B90E3F|nr:SigB/SigF/SigG family RNA polymerase sigma factor [Patulibacter minatonensis]
MLEDATRREQHDLELLRRHRTQGDPWARDELTERCMPLVRSIARKYASSREPFEDLVQAGSIGLVKAIDRFDLDAGHRFVSYAIPTIQGEIRRHFRDHCWAVRVPRSTQELWQRVKHEQRAFVEHTGRDATPGDLALALEVPEEDVADALRAGEGYDALSLDHPAGEDRAMLDVQGDSDPGFATVEDRSVVAQAFDVLDDRARRVVHDRFYRERLQREIAVDVGVSQMQVSRVVSGALEDMRRHLLHTGAAAADARTQAA